MFFLILLFGNVGKRRIIESFQWRPFHIMRIIKSSIRNIIKKNKTIYNILRKLIIYRKKSLRKKKIVNRDGIHENETFYVIRAASKDAGLMAYYNSIIGHIDYALKNGWIPVVDMMNYKSQYLSEEEVGRVNAWENYFCQPFDYTLHEVYQSRNIILSDGDMTVMASPRVQGIRLKNKEYMNRISYIIKNYIKLNKDTKDYIEDNARCLLEGGIGIGVVSRGTDLIGYVGHSVQPNTEHLIEICKGKMNEWGADYIFLASEEERVIDKFKLAFGEEKIRYNNAMRFDCFNDGILAELPLERKNDPYLRGKEYLTSVYMLSRCNYLIGTYVGATVAALEINGGQYKDVYIIDLGIYQ